MWKQHVFIIGFLIKSHYCIELWEKNSECPKICTCQTQHVTETAIYRFMLKDKNKPLPGEGASSVENNEALYYEDEFGIDWTDRTVKSVTMSATCILQTETETQDLIEAIPSKIDSLTLIQGYQSGNKTIFFSYLTKFPDLRSLEIIGPSSLKNPINNSYLLCEIDVSLPNLKYMNLETIFIQNSKKQSQEFLKQAVDEKVTFEFVQKLDEQSHPITLIQKSSKDEVVVPYTVFKEQRKINGDTPLFMGFKKLVLLRVSNCGLNSIQWQMFDGLHELNYLILERNNLRFIPSFAFYGTPNLKSLSLAHNKLLDMQVSDLAGLLKLEHLDLSYNNFSQLSELSLPPFPNLKLANFANNPIGVVFPNTFEVMNTTASLVIGSNDMPLTLMPNSFLGLDSLKTLTLNNLNMPILKRDFFFGLPKLQELIISGNISKIEFDAFLEIANIEKLILSNCNMFNVSMDAFIGLQKLEYLDLSHNLFEYIPPGVFDGLTNLKELYLNGNKFHKLPRDIFSKIIPKLIRLNENPWHCSCEMSDWKLLVVNNIKQKSFKPCDFSLDKGIGCSLENRYEIKYVFDNKIAPKCIYPRRTVNMSVFLAMKTVLKCSDFKAKFKRKPRLLLNRNLAQLSSLEANNKDLKYKMLKNKIKRTQLRMRLNKNSLNKSSTSSNENSIINDMNDVSTLNYNKSTTVKSNDLSNNII